STTAPQGNRGDAGLTRALDTGYCRILPLSGLSGTAKARKPWRKRSGTLNIPPPRPPAPPPNAPPPAPPAKPGAALFPPPPNPPPKAPWPPRPPPNENGFEP